MSALSALGASSHTTLCLKIRTGHVELSWRWWWWKKVSVVKIVCCVCCCCCCCSVTLPGGECYSFWLFDHQQDTVWMCSSTLLFGVSFLFFRLFRMHLRWLLTPIIRLITEQKRKRRKEEGWRVLSILSSQCTRNCVAWHLPHHFSPLIIIFFLLHLPTAQQWTAYLLFKSWLS